jgi:hypothetical protein
MKILLVTFDKEMDKKVRELLKDYQIVTVKNGEEALLLNMDDIDLIIYDALAGGIAEEDINKLYDEGFKNVPYIILMDDLFPIDPQNIKPKNKKVISREVEVDKLPELVKELISKKGEAKEEETVVETQTEQPAIEAATAESWEEMFGTAVTPPKEEKKEETPSATVSETPAVEEKKEETPPVEEKPAPAEEKKEETTAAPEQPSTDIGSLKKQCLIVSFDMPLVDKIEEKIRDLCDIYVARSSKQALKKYQGKDFDIIIFDTISGVFAEKGIRDLYEKGGYKDSLYVILLDEFMPIDIDKLPVKNMRAIKRESELDLLPEIVESAPHITLEKALESAAAAIEQQSEQTAEAPPAEKQKEEAPAAATQEAEPSASAVEEKVEETPAVQKEEKTAELEGKPVEKTPVAPQPAPAKAAPAPTAQPATYVSEEQIAKIVEQKINQMVVPLIEEIVRNKLTDTYLKTLVREILQNEVSPADIREIVQEIAEPMVKEILEQLLS